MKSFSFGGVFIEKWLVISYNSIVENGGVDMSCNHNCSTCSSKGSCSEKQFFQTTKSNIKHIIGVMSGKGGVGKSTVTSLLALNMALKGYKVGILDADITGPSIPHAFGLKGRLKGSNNEMYPLETKLGIKIVSINLLLNDSNEPVVWRGPILGNAVKQFYSETVWGDIDYLFIDMPPGTSDIQLTVLNNIPLSGVIMVSSPQDLVSMVVSKCVNMVKKVNVNIIGLIENMSYIKCPCCDNKIEIYGKSHLNEIAKKHHLIPLANLGIDTKLSSLMDEGRLEEYHTSDLDVALNQIIML